MYGPAEYTFEDKLSHISHSHKKLETRPSYDVYSAESNDTVNDELQDSDSCETDFDELSRASSPSSFFTPTAENGYIYPDRPREVAPSPPTSATYPPSPTSSQGSLSARRSRDYEGRFDSEVWPEDEDEDDVEAIMYEQQLQCMPKFNMIAIQPEVTWDMRKTMVRWLIEVHTYLGNLHGETLYLSVNIFDQYLSVAQVQRIHLQLVGTTSMWVAIKYRENRDRVPDVNKLISLCGNGYPKDFFKQMEQHICRATEWRFWNPTAEGFLKFESSNGLTDERTLSLARYLMEHTLLSERFIEVLPSVIAEASLHLARRLLKKPVLAIRKSDVKACVENIGEFVRNNRDDFIFKKFKLSMDIRGLHNC